MELRKGGKEMSKEKMYSKEELNERIRTEENKAAFKGILAGTMFGTLIWGVLSVYLIPDYSPKKGHMEDANKDGKKDFVYLTEEGNKKIMYSFEGEFYSKKNLKEIITQRHEDQINEIETKSKSDLEKELKKYENWREEEN